uniref:uncharacterized protein n=1 Tax=Myxine glutinosa TaxID=7769 RepID=UPI00358F9D68
MLNLPNVGTFADFTICGLFSRLFGKSTFLVFILKVSTLWPWEDSAPILERGVHRTGQANKVYIEKDTLLVTHLAMRCLFMTIVVAVWLCELAVQAYRYVPTCEATEDDDEHFQTFVRNFIMKTDTGFGLEKTMRHTDPAVDGRHDHHHRHHHHHHNRRYAGGCHTDQRKSGAKLPKSQDTLEQRSVTPWIYEICEEAPGSIPRLYAVARCQTRHCLDPSTGRETLDGNAVTVNHSMTVWRSWRCPGTPERYALKPYKVSVPVACVCVRPKRYGNGKGEHRTEHRDLHMA